jgi:cell division protease FtsH
VPPAATPPGLPGRAGFSLAYYFLVFGTIFALNYWLFSGPGVAKVPYSAFLERVEAGRVAEVVITEDVIYGLSKAAKPAKPAAGPGIDPPGEHTPWRLEWDRLKARVAGFDAKLEAEQAKAVAERKRHFTVTPLPDAALIPLLQKHGVQFQGRIESKWASNLFWNWVLPFGALFLLWGFLMRRMGKGPAALSMGRKQPKIVEVDPENRVRFAEIAGADEAVEEVREVVAFLKEPAQFTRLGAKLPKGVLLVGPPGTGKTLLARAVAGEAEVPFFAMSGSDFVEMFVGVGASRVRQLFEAAKAKAPCIVFIDELDAIGKSRGSQGAAMGGYDERENTLNQLLVEMDGFDARAGVVLMAATNRPEVLDKALLRPGRFDRQVLVDRPHREGRRAIFAVHVRELILAEDVDLDRLAAETAGFAGADIANLCNEAALLASRRDRERIAMADFQDAFERVIGGLEKKGKLLSEADRRRVAIHESGHALVGWFTPGQDPVQKISIVPRGHAALGYTLQFPVEDHLLLLRSELEGRVRVLLGGRAAEELVLGEISTGASDDLEKASRLLREMLGVHGMSQQLPNFSLADSTSPGFLGQGAGRAAYSEETARVLDAELLEALRSAYEAAAKLLAEKRDLLGRLADRLLEAEKLEHEDLVEVLGARTG